MRLTAAELRSQRGGLRQARGPVRNPHRNTGGGGAIPTDSCTKYEILSRGHATQTSRNHRPTLLPGPPGCGHTAPCACFARFDGAAARDFHRSSKRKCSADSHACELRKFTSRPCDSIITKPTTSAPSGAIRIWGAPSGGRARCSGCVWRVCITTKKNGRDFSTTYVRIAKFI